jgi:DNA repair exonuclease SbcCD ATPase subunit
LTATKQWSRAAPAGPRPPGRYGHSLNIIGSKIYIFGGQVEGFFFNDLVTFDLNALQQASNRWETLIQNTIDGGPPHGQIPPARTNHSVVTWNEKLYLFGGTDGVTWFSDVWAYDPRTNSWSQLECIGYIPVAREGHAAALVGDVMYVFGGRTEEGNDLGDLAAFRITTRRWYTFQNMGPSPSPRSGHSMTAFGKHIVVTGGEPSSAPRDAAELSLAYYLDTSKIRYPNDSQSQMPADQRIQGHRRPSGDRSGIPQSRASPRDQADFDGPRRPGRDSSIPINRAPEPMAVGSRLPRAAGPPGPGPAPPQQQQQQQQQQNKPTTPPSRQPTRPERALSPNQAGASPTVVTRMAPGPFHNDSFGARTMSPTAATPTMAGTNTNISSNSLDDDQDRTPQTYKPTHQPISSIDKSMDQTFSPPSRTSSRTAGSQPTRENAEEPPSQLMHRTHPSLRNLESQEQSDRGNSVDMSRHPAQRDILNDDARQDVQREAPVNGALDETAVPNNGSLTKELETEKTKNAWFASELTLARRAGYSRSTTNTPAFDEPPTDAFGDDDRPLVEALLRMRAELAKVQGSIDSQAEAAAARIAEIEKQRDTAISEAVFAKAKLAGQGGASPLLDSSRHGTPDTDRVGDMSRRLASSLAAQTELSRKIDSLIHEKEAEKQARLLAEETAEAAQQRVTELNTDRQRIASEIETLRAELHEAQKTSREASANHADALTSHKLLAVDKTELSSKLENALAEAAQHGAILGSLREALTASTDKSNLLEERLEEEKRGRNELEQQHSQLRSQHEERATELESTSRRLRDAEGLAEKHAAEARTHRQAVLDGLGKISSRGSDTRNGDDERVSILHGQVETANTMARQNQAAADSASEKLRRAEERIAGLESYQEQASREGLTIRKQLQAALKEARTLTEERADLQQQLQSQQLETNAIAVQHGALKDILSERGVNPVDVRKSRGFDSPSSQIRFGTPDIQRVKELEQQLEANLRAHEDMKTSLEEMQDREGLTRKEYEEKLATLHNDHQAAVKYLRGTEKMLSKMKQELQRVKNQAADYAKELDTMRTKENDTRSLGHETNANHGDERDDLRKDLEKMKTDLEAQVSTLHHQLGEREVDLNTLRNSHETTQSSFAALQSTHETSRADLERLQRENVHLEERARDAENKVQLLLDQVESSVDNYRRQSSMPNGAANGFGHHRALSNVSASTANFIPAHSRGHSRGESLGGDSIYSQSAAASETGDNEVPDGRDSLALDNLATELDALRTQWETTNKSYRISDLEFEKTPRSGTTPTEFGLDNWRRGLEVGDDDDDDRPSTSSSAAQPMTSSSSAAAHQSVKERA